ncbi:diacylglycerol kinase family protein [Geobacter sp. AOG1]|uniref:diacylglycerol/lipid kinase family protein n=1 Tax=Geobacter sp. AOG1 TaxID=1566346 RepID=UPI001CC572A9|nr:diacylglycerol kinase family protein [Geobacter sp. AOG1]GFE57568.1 diacylglycerol kinase [Geobacter sp. AOG1]
MNNRCFLIVNPTSGGYSPRRIEEIVATLRRRGKVPELLLTGSAADASLFARRICTEAAEPFIVVGGGDGTINGVLNGLAPGKATLAILPLGTANVLAKELGIRSLEDAIRKITGGEARSMAVGLLEAQEEKRYFSLMAGIGFDGAVVEDVRLGEKRVVGKGAYVLSAMRRLAAWDREPLRIRADGREVECHSAVICNGARYGGDFVLAPGADIFTPGFQLVCIKGCTRRTYARLTLELLRGLVPTEPGVITFPARLLEISVPKAVQVDGDYAGRSPLRITAVEKFVKVLV